MNHFFAVFDRPNPVSAINSLVTASSSITSPLAEGCPLGLRGLLGLLGLLGLSPLIVGLRTSVVSCTGPGSRSASSFTIVTPETFRVWLGRKRAAKVAEGTFPRGGAAVASRSRWRLVLVCCCAPSRNPKRSVLLIIGDRRAGLSPLPLSSSTPPTGSSYSSCMIHAFSHISPQTKPKTTQMPASMATQYPVTVPAPSLVVLRKL